MTDVNPANDPFLQWLNTGSTVRETVEMFLDRAALREAEPLWAELDALEAQLEDADDESPSGQRALGEKSARSRIAAEIEGLRERLAPIEARIAASKAVWELRPLDDDEINEIDAKYPMPPMPIPTEEQKTSEKAMKRWQGLYSQYVDDKAAVDVQRTLAKVAAAVVTLATPSQVLDGVSEEYLQALSKKPLGSKYIDMLTHAFNRVMTLEEPPARPLSSTPSGSDPA